jgi:hypothetical protein
MSTSPNQAHSHPMQPNHHPGALPLDCAAEIIVELQLLRAECCAAAQHAAGQIPLDEAALEECARLDDALGRAHRLLLGAVAEIKRSRSSRQRQ